MLRALQGLQELKGLKEMLEQVRILHRQINLQWYQPYRVFIIPMMETHGQMMVQEEGPLYQEEMWLVLPGTELSGWREMYQDI